MKGFVDKEEFDVYEAGKLLCEIAVESIWRRDVAGGLDLSRRKSSQVEIAEGDE